MSRLERAKEFNRKFYSQQVLNAQKMGVDINLSIGELAGIAFDAISDVPVKKAIDGEEWRTGVKYELGIIVRHENVEYKVTQAHISQMDWKPGATGVYLFEKVVKPMDEWTSGVTYKVGDKCKYKGKTYECTFAHTSIETWYPGALGIYFWQEI